MRGCPLVVVHLLVLLTLRRGPVADGKPDVLQSTTSSPLSVSVVQGGILPHFLDQCRCTTSNMFVLNMVKGHHLQLKAQPLLFCNFHLFQY